MVNIEEQIKDQTQKISKVVFRSKITWVVVVLILFISLFYQSFFVFIKPYEMGLKQVNVSLLGNQGLQKKVYGPGWQLKMPFLHEYIIFPKDLLVYELADNRSTSGSNKFFYQRGARGIVEASQHIPDEKYMRQAAVNIQTNDGFYVRVDVTVIFKIVDPYKVATVLGRNPEEYFQNGIARKAESVLKDSFGRLTTEEFYNSLLRQKMSNEARDLFNTKIEREGLMVEHVLVRYFEYSEDIQRNIEEKKLKDQLVFKNQSEARAAIEEAKIKKVREEGEAAIKVELEKGRAYVTRKNADKEAYVRKKRAAGDLLYKLAEAKKTKLINDAYISRGSKRLVGLEMAKVLEGIDLIVIPSDGANGINPLDLNKIQKLFGVTGK